MGFHQKVKMKERDFQEGKGKMLSQKNEEWGNLGDLGQVMLRGRIYVLGMGRGRGKGESVFRKK